MCWLSNMNLENSWKIGLLSILYNKLRWIEHLETLFGGSLDLYFKKNVESFVNRDIQIHKNTHFHL